MRTLGAVPAGGMFFNMPKWWQGQRIRELRSAWLSPDLIAMITSCGLLAVRQALETRR